MDPTYQLNSVNLNFYVFTFPNLSYIGLAPTAAHLFFD